MNSKLTCFCLFANCIPIKGYRRSLIMDLQANKYLYIPNQLHFILEEYCNKPLNDVFAKYSEYEVIIEEYYSFLISEKLGHYVPINQFSSFPRIDFKFQYPGTLTNCIIEMSSTSNPLLINKVIVELSEKLGVLNFLLLIHSCYSTVELIDVLAIIESVRYNSLEVVSSLIEDEFNNVLERSTDSGIISKLSIYNGYNITQKQNINYNGRELSNSSCAQVCINRMIINMEYYAESISYSSCLHRKISIDTHGNIKNCPSCSKSFGNIKDTTLEQALSHPEFKKHWNITKDQIDVCKDCEFRHMCTDCRVFIKDSENPYSQPSKCTYNPYIAKWKGEEGYVPVEECGTYTRESGFVVNPGRVAELNNQIWGE